VTTGGELTCERDRAVTRLTCVQCAAPICPQCLVRTPVGLKCPVCGAQRQRAGRGAPREATWAVPLVVAAVLLAVFGLPKLFSSKTTPQGAGSTANPLRDTIPQPVGVAGPELRVRYARIGQEARDGDLAFTIKSMDCGATQVTGGPVGVTAQGRYCFVKITVKNYGRSPATVLGSSQVLYDAQSRRFQPDANATSADPDNAGQDFNRGVVVNPGNELAGVLVFDVPPDVNPVVASLRANPGQGTYINVAPGS
jgi:hypothetical protein